MQVLHSDKRRRVTLPAPAAPEDSWISEVIRPDQILLTRIKAPALINKPRLVKHQGYTVGILPRPVDPQTIARALEEFP